jgi:glycosyltransferase involved in cell wall biosynthesis
LRLLLVTDAWSPQVNGVVVTLRNTIACLERWGHEVSVLSPEGLATVPMPTYPEIPLALFPGRAVARRFEAFDPDAVHIATEGPVGMAARSHCLAHGLAFTTAYHTRFPEYLQARFRLPLAWSYAWLRRFHAPSSAVLVGTGTVRGVLEERGFANLADWTRGVDLGLFCPGPERFEEYPRPVFTFVGRLAVEKDIPAFLRLDLPGTKLVVGDGPERERLRRRFPNAVFTGARSGAELASLYRRSDAFVFPSRTDTFGLVLLEAMACGVPVAALPVPGPVDVVGDPSAGVLDGDLREAALAALLLDRADVRRYAERFSWERSARQFAARLTPAAPRLTPPASGNAARTAHRADPARAGQAGPHS